MRLLVTPLLFLLAVSTFAQSDRRGNSRVPPGPPRLGTGPSPFAHPASFHPERQLGGAPFVGPVAFPGASRPWIRIETPHFLLISSASERRTRTIARDLERLTATLTRISAHFRAPVQRTRVFVFTNRRDVQPYFDAVCGFAGVDASGLTVRQADRSTILIDANTRGGDWLTPRHELIHLLLRGDHPLPLWLEEGLAEYYSNAGQPVREHVSLLATPRKLPMERLFSVAAGTPQAGSWIFYAKSWAVVSTLIRRNESAFFAFIGDIANGPTCQSPCRRIMAWSSRNSKEHSAAAEGRHP